MARLPLQMWKINMALESCRGKETPWRGIVFCGLQLKLLKGGKMEWNEWRRDAAV